MNEEKKKKSNLELITVILLGITAVATGWASWQGSMHGSLQSQKYTDATRLTAQANADWSDATNRMSQDMNIWNQIIGLNIEHAFALEKGNSVDVEKFEWQMEMIMANNVGEDTEFSKAIEWAGEQEEYASPFDNEEFIEHYFEDASALLKEADQIMEEGNKNSANGDNQGLVSVIYAVVLFMLGIMSPFKEERTKKILLVISLVGFLAATVFMLTIPVVLP